MLARILWYILFLIAVAVYVAITAFVQPRLQNRKSIPSRFLANQVQILGGLVPIVVIPWILAGFFSRNFALLLIAAFEISSLFNYVSSRLSSHQTGLRMRLWSAELLGVPSAPDEGEMRRLGFQQTWQKSKRLLLFLFAGFLVLLGGVFYLVVASYIYFANPLHSEIATRKILTLNMALYILGALVVAVLNVHHISSRRISDPIRRALFLNQAVYALQIGIILTVYLGLLGVNIEALVPGSLTLPVGFGYYIPLIVLTTFYLLILVVPYLMGLAGRRREQIALYQTIQRWLAAVIETVGIPSHRDAEQLGKLRDEFSQETEKWIESEPMVKDFALKIERAGSNTSLLKKPVQDLTEAYHVFKDQDTRFIKFNWTERMKEKLDEMKEEYDRYASQWNMMDMYIKLGDAYEKFFRDEERAYQERLKLTEERKILAPVMARAIGVLGAVPVVLQYGQKLMALLPFTQ